LMIHSKAICKRAEREREALLGRVANATN